jgi:sulfite reductase alpha subunit-like flavoprotein
VHTPISDVLISSTIINGEQRNQILSQLIFLKELPATVLIHLLFEIMQLFDVFTSYMNEQQQQHQRIIKEDDEEIQLKAGASVNDFATLCKHQIPLIPSNLHAILHDVVSVNQKVVNTKILTFPLFHQRVCLLVHVPSSQNSYRFTHNANRRVQRPHSLECGLYV